MSDDHATSGQTPDEQSFNSSRKPKTQYIVTDEPIAGPSNYGAIPNSNLEEQDYDDEYSEDHDLENQTRNPCDFSSWKAARYSVGRYFFLVLLFYSGVYLFWTPQLWW